MTIPVVSQALQIKANNSAVAVNTLREPPEGARSIHLELAANAFVWQHVVVPQWNSNTQNGLSQIASIEVSNNTQAVSFYFPDTGSQIGIPPLFSGIIPIYTSGLDFYIFSADAAALNINNFFTPPMGVLSTKTNSFANEKYTNGFAITATTTLSNIISQSRTITDFDISVDAMRANAGANSLWVFSLNDGPTPIWQAETDLALGTTDWPNRIIANKSGLAYYLNNAASFVVSVFGGAPLGGNCYINIGAR